MLYFSYDFSKIFIFFFFLENNFSFQLSTDFYISAITF